MKKNLLAFSVFTSLLMFSGVCVSSDSGTPPPKQITINAKANSSNDRANGWQKGIKETLPAGVWQIKAANGGWSTWKSDSNAPPNIKGPWTWNVFIKAGNEGNIDCFGLCADWWKYSNPKAALTGAQGEEPTKLLQLTAQTDVYFWLFDDGDNTDNRGDVVVELLRIK